MLSIQPGIWYSQVLRATDQHFGPGTSTSDLCQVRFHAWVFPHFPPDLVSVVGAPRDQGNS